MNHWHPLLTNLSNRKGLFNSNTVFKADLVKSCRALSRPHTVPKLTPDGHTIKEMFKFCQMSKAESHCSDTKNNNDDDAKRFF